MKQPIFSLLASRFLWISTPVAIGQCHASFTWEQAPGTLQIFFHSTSTSEHDITSYQWIFDDGHMGDGQNPNHTYAEPGTYLVCLIIHDGAGCASDVCHEVTVEGTSSECDASFNWEQEQGTLQIFFHTTSMSNHDIISYQWNFGDGHMGDGQNPNHTYAEPGPYGVCLIIHDGAGCARAECHELTVERPSSD
jgi:PKD repeat protein